MFGFGKKGRGAKGAQGLNAGKDDEKRLYKRLPAAFMILYRVQEAIQLIVLVGGDELDGTATDISEGGIGILVNGKVPPYALLTVAFELTQHAAGASEVSVRRFNIQGQARYAEKCPDGKYRVGIQFTFLTDDQKQFITQYIKQNELKFSE